MNDKICINYNYFIFIMVLIVAIFYLFNINNNNQYNDLNRQLNNIKNEYQQNLNKQSQTNQASEPKETNNEEAEEEVLVSSRYFNPKSYKPLVDKLIDERDKDAYEDPLTAPTRRLPRHIYPTQKKDYIFIIQ